MPQASEKHCQCQGSAIKEKPFGNSCLNRTSQASKNEVSKCLLEGLDVLFFMWYFQGREGRGDKGFHKIRRKGVRMYVYVDIYKCMLLPPPLKKALDLVVRESLCMQRKNSLMFLAAALLILANVHKHLQTFLPRNSLLADHELCAMQGSKTSENTVSRATCLFLDGDKAAAASKWARSLDLHTLSLRNDLGELLTWTYCSV